MRDPIQILIFFLQSGFLVQEKATNERLNNVKDRFFDEEQKRIGRNRTKAEGKIFEIPIGTFFYSSEGDNNRYEEEEKELAQQKKEGSYFFRHSM